MKMLKVVITVVMCLASAVLFGFALDWRSPFLADMRNQMLAGIIGLSLFLIWGQRWCLSAADARRSALWWVNLFGAVTAGLALMVTLMLEARFHWVRSRVLHTEIGRLEKVGRHLIVGYRDFSQLVEIVKRRALAGVFVSSRNVEGKNVAQVREELEHLQRMRKEQGLPRLWIATDEEGGAVNRLAPPLTRFPALSAIVEAHSDIAEREKAVREFGLNQGRELADIGVNLNFAPVVDLNYHVINPDDRYTRIFQRAISRDPKVVAQVAAWYCAALKETGVSCTLKHFPGLGRVYEDTHCDSAQLTVPIEELEKTDWVPFRKLMSQSTAFVMLGHACLTAMDSERPVSTSSRVIGGMLRGAWIYEGVLVTDNFSMMALYRSRGGIERASIDALNAGVDLILVSYDPDQYYRVAYALLRADAEGKLDKETLKKSDRRLERALQ